MSERDIDFKSVHLTPKQQDVVRLLSEGMLYKQIAEVLHISPRTVEGHIRSVTKKTDCHNKVAIVNFAREVGLVGKAQKELEPVQVLVDEMKKVVLIKEQEEQRGLQKNNHLSYPHLEGKSTLSNKKIGFLVLAMLLVNGVCLVVLIKLLLSFYKT